MKVLAKSMGSLPDFHGCTFPGYGRRKEHRMSQARGGSHRPLWPTPRRESVVCSRGEECKNKLPAMKSSAACIMCFHISYARPSWLRNARACCRLTGQPCSFPSRIRCESVISAITRSLSFFSVIALSPTGLLLFRASLKPLLEPSSR